MHIPESLLIKNRKSQPVSHFRNDEMLARTVIYKSNQQQTTFKLVQDKLLV